MITTATAIAVGAAGIFSAGVGGAINAGAARERLSAEERALQQQIDERARITKAARAQAKISPNEIKSINNLMATQESGLNQTLDSIAKQQQQLDAMDPQVKAAGSELLALLKGEASRALAPVRAMQDRERKKVEARLAETMGPGWQTTSAGMEALARFDAQASLVTAQVQQDALGKATQAYLGLAGTQASGQQGVTSATQNAFANAAAIDQTVLAAHQNVQSRMLAAETQAPKAAPVNFQGPAAVAGGEAAAWGNMFNNIGGTLLGGAGQIAGAQMQGQMFNNALSNMNVNAFANNIGPMQTMPATNNNMFATGTV